MVLLLLTYENGLWHQYSLSDYFMGVLRLDRCCFCQSDQVSYLPNRRMAEVIKSQHHKKITFWSVVAGIVIAIPVVAALTCFAGCSGSDLLYEGQ